MNKHQTKVIAVMLACALAFSGIVLMRDRGAADGHEEAHADQPADAGDGIVRFSDAQVQSAGITLSEAGPRRIDSFIRMPGQIVLNEDRTAHVTPRAAGAVEAVAAKLGQRVANGEVLATLASAEVAGQRAALAAAEGRLALARASHATEKTLWEEKIGARQDLLKAEQELREAAIAVRSARQVLGALGSPARGDASNRLQVRSPFDGEVVEKHVVLGEVVGADTRIFTIADLSQVWADVVVPAKDLEIVRVGTPAVIR